jgi:hypothetical protein
MKQAVKSQKYIPRWGFTQTIYILPFLPLLHFAFFRFHPKEKNNKRTSFDATLPDLISEPLICRPSLPCRPSAESKST